ncbi:hypothetical protein H0H81_012404 [Sphagnurus paluster]|uniref:Uncharacterized protein n=1 Tax=Sphagnurus paluster TaxID=117069 RepID=A0A9P7K389_9AGAR|nr:hypothetical protein H0H81_012404 [Sphagnurus paluster]
MAGFLRKKTKSDPKNKSRSAQSPPVSASTSVPPLFARFSSTSQPNHEPPRIVSSPMLLSSGSRREVTAPHQNQIRGARTVTQAAVQSHHGADNRLDRYPSRNGGSGHEILREETPQQYSPTQARLRPVSRVSVTDNSPSSSSFQPHDTLSPSTPPPARPSSRPRSVEHPSPTQGEYAHLWSMIAGQDNPTGEPADPMSVPNLQTSRSNAATTNMTIRSDFRAPGFRPLPQVGSNGLPNPPIEAQRPSGPTTSPVGHDSSFHGPDHSQTSMGPSKSSIVTGAASESHTTVYYDNMRYNDTSHVGFGTRPGTFSHNLSSPSPDFVSNQSYPSATSPNPSMSNANPGLPNGKLSGQLPTPATFEDSRSISEANRKSYVPPPDSNMGIASSAPHRMQQPFEDMPSQLPNHQHIPNFPPQTYVSSQQRSSAVYPSNSPPRKSSVKAANSPLVTGKPLIFTAMASIDQDSPPRPLPQICQSKSQSKANPTLRQQYSSNPGELGPPPVRKESLHSRPLPLPQYVPPRPRPQIPNGNHHFAPPVLPPFSQQETFEQPPPLPSKDFQTNALNPTPPPVPSVEHLPRAPSRTRRPSSKTRHSQPTDPALPTNTTSHHRTPAKGRPATPISPGPVGPLQIDPDTLVDQDPFAKTEGVTLVKPSSSRPTTPSSGIDGNGKGRKSHEASEEEQQRYSDAVSHTELTRPRSVYSQHGASHTPRTQTPPSPVMPEKRLPGHSARRLSKGKRSKSRGPEPTVVAPPIIDSFEGADDRLTPFMSQPNLFATLLSFLSFYDWCMVLSISREIRFMIVQDPALREAVLERFLKTVGCTIPPLFVFAVFMKLFFVSQPQDLNDYMRGVSTPTHEYARVASLYVHSLSIDPAHRDQSLAETVRHLSASTRAYSRVVLRLRAQAEKEVAVARSKSRSLSRPASRSASPAYSQSNHSHSYPQSGARTSFQSPLFRLKRAPLLRVFVPSPEGDWLSDKSVLECEAECRRAGVMALMRIGDVVWDVAVGDEGNVGRLVWDGSYLIDLDYTYSSIGDLPKYMPALAFPPSYFHRVIRTGPSSSNPVAHVDLRPWGEEIAINLQLLQDRVRTETPQGAYHNVVRWVHRSSFVIRPPAKSAAQSPSSYKGSHSPARIPIPDTNMFVDPGWYGTIVVETEGTNESLADLQDRCGPGAFPPRAAAIAGRKPTALDKDGKLVFRILREKRQVPCRSSEHDH